MSIRVLCFVITKIFTNCNSCCTFQNQHSLVPMYALCTCIGSLHMHACTSHTHTHNTHTHNTHTDTPCTYSHHTHTHTTHTHHARIHTTHITHTHITHTHITHTHTHTHNTRTHTTHTHNTRTHTTHRHTTHTDTHTHCVYMYQYLCSLSANIECELIIELEPHCYIHCSRYTLPFNAPV